jgi:hypothetical protein
MWYTFRHILAILIRQHSQFGEHSYVSNLDYLDRFRRFTRFAVKVVLEVECVGLLLVVWGNRTFAILLL